MEKFFNIFILQIFSNLIYIVYRMLKHQKSQYEPFIIVFGHEKGGTGKSTLCSHSTVGLLYHVNNCKVGVIDLDMRQATTYNFFKHRELHSFPLIVPTKFVGLKQNNGPDLNENIIKDIQNLEEIINEMTYDGIEYILIDTAGSYSNFSISSISKANLLITPLSDSFIDINVLVRVDQNNKVYRRGPYVDTVLQQKKEKMIKNPKSPFWWMLVRNRVSNIHYENSEICEETLKNICRNIGCELGYTVADRVVYKETFNYGLTIFDIPNLAHDISLTKIKAHKEMNGLICKILDIKYFQDNIIAHTKRKTL